MARDVTWFERDELRAAVQKRIEPAEIVLDIGCGIQPQRLISSAVHICCEPFGQYVEVLQEKLRYDCSHFHLVMQVSWAAAVELFPPESVDTVFLLDLVEHLDKEEGLALLRRTERLARKQVVVYTPLGFLPQSHADGRDAWGLNGGDWQEHKSGWQLDDFDESWSIVASKRYFDRDSHGTLFKEPFGAFWAIKTLSDTSRAPRPAADRLPYPARRRARIHRCCDRLIDLIFGAERK